MLDLSTKHLPEEVCEDLNGFDGVIADERSYGWLLWVPEDIDQHLKEYTPESEPMTPPDDPNYGDVHHAEVQDQQLLLDETIPPAIVEVWRFAEKHDCQYVLIDQDGAEYTSLNSYDW
jgi:hypothetical protein